MTPIILIIESHQDQFNQFKKQLEADYDCLHATSGQQGLQLFDVFSVKIKAILLSFDLTDMSSQVVLDQLVNTSFFSEIITYSKKNDIQLAVKAIKGGAFQHFIEPFDISDIRVVLDKVITQIDMVKKIKLISRHRYLQEFDVTKGLEIAKELVNKRRSENKDITANEVFSILHSSENSNKALYQSMAIDFDAIFPFMFPNQKNHILIIDDDETVCSYLDTLFSNQYNLSFAHSIQDAFSQSKNQFDVILLDIFLPDGKGTDVIVSLKEKYLSAEIIVITAFEIVDLAIIALKNGAFNYINKPLLKDTLLEMVEKALHQRNLRAILQELNMLDATKALPFRTTFEMFKTHYEQMRSDEKVVTYKDLFLFFPDYNASGSFEPHTIISSDLDSDELMEWMLTTFSEEQ